MKALRLRDRELQRFEGLVFGALIALIKETAYCTQISQKRQSRHGPSPIRMAGRRITTARRFVMVIIAMFGGLILGGGVLAALKHVGDQRDSRKTMHIV